MMAAPIDLRGLRLDWSRVYVVGVLNVTPDSFSDGGELVGVEAAVAHAAALVAAGADLIDVGGEASNPRARAVDADEELARVLPVIEALAARMPAVPVSIDTTKAVVAEAAVAAGAQIINDVSGGLFDARMAGAAAATGAVYVCGHLRGTSLAEVFGREGEPPGFEEVAAELADRLAALAPAVRARTIIDPGLGFGKGSGAINIELTRRAGELGARLGRPVLLGPSRKRFVATMAGAAASDRSVLDVATVGACLAAVDGGANMLRVHNVRLLCPALMVYEQMRRGV
jgi:dihydropteroate synthase